MVTYGGTVTFHMNGEIARAIPVPVAHTNGDTMVYFENADVLMTGDFLPLGGVSQHCHSERRIVGRHVARPWSRDRKFRTKHANPSGHGPIVDRDEVRAHRDMMLVLMGQVQERLDQGMTEDQIVAAGLTNVFDSQVRNPGTTNERFIPPVGPGVTVRTLIKYSYHLLGVEAPVPPRREERAYREYVSNEQRRGAGCIGGQNGNFILVSVLRKEFLPRVSSV